MNPMKTAFAKPLLVLGVALTLSAPAGAQKEFLRSNPQFVASFRDVVAKPSASTVRIVCDGKDTALGMVVGADGWILTKANDLKGTVAVRLKDGREFPATIVGVHEGHDLAMLKIDATNLVPVTFTPSKGIDAGSWVACAGIQTDPVAVGVVSVSTRTIVNKGPGKAPDMSKTGFLGVSLQAADGGVRIEGIEPRSAAEKSGLKLQDVVISLGGKNITKVDMFREEIGKHKPGDVVTLKVRREDEELDIQATLGKWPANRGDVQNKMGSELSSRRSGYGTILQHDSVVKPTDCGGPIVDLDGHVIGINICRAGRTESWAVPSEVLQTVLADLKSGKLAPPASVASDSRAKTLESVAKEDGKAQALNDLVYLMKQRLELSFDVARYKFAHQLPISDGAREERLLSKLLQAAEDEGLDKNLARAFFAAQFAASRALQENLHARWTKDGGVPSSGDIPDLKQTLRPRIDKVSMDLVHAFAKAQPYLRETAVHQLLRQRASQVLQGDAALEESVRNRALEGWLLPK
jgi:serine protease Do